MYMYGKVTSINHQAYSWGHLVELYIMFNTYTDSATLCGFANLEFFY